MSSSTNTCVNNDFHWKTVEAAAVAIAPPPLPRVSNPQQGIVSILGSDSDQSGRAAPSIRRTLSADTSSKNWLYQNGSIKKIASSGGIAAFSSSASSEGEEEDEFIKRPGQDEVWKSIQAQKLQGIVNGDDQKPIRSISSWSSILLSPKSDQDSDKLPLPYIHPLVKKSSSSLSKQSLEICTESLGSETGSDRLSSQSGDSDHIQPEVQEKEDKQKNVDEFQDVKINYSKKSPPPFLPPPLPSLAKSSVQLRSHRQGGGGRLILEAVSFPQHNYFHAERSDGRLLLTALKSPSSQEPSHEEVGDETEDFGKVLDEIEEFGKVFDEIEEVDNNSDDGYEGEEDQEEEEEKLSQLPQSLPPQSSGVERLVPAATASFDPYHCYWKKSINTPSIAAYKQQEGLIPMLRSCKEARTSILKWEPNFCIATS